MLKYILLLFISTISFAEIEPGDTGQPAKLPYGFDQTSGGVADEVNEGIAIYDSGVTKYLQSTIAISSGNTEVTDLRFENLTEGDVYQFSLTFNTFSPNPTACWVMVLAGDGDLPASEVLVGHAHTNVQGTTNRLSGGNFQGRFIADSTGLLRVYFARSSGSGNCELLASQTTNSVAWGPVGGGDPSPNTYMYVYKVKDVQ